MQQSGKSGSNVAKIHISSSLIRYFSEWGNLKQFNLKQFKTSIRGSHVIYVPYLCSISLAYTFTSAATVFISSVIKKIQINIGACNDKNIKFTMSCAHMQNS